MGLRVMVALGPHYAFQTTFFGDVSECTETFASQVSLRLEGLGFRIRGFWSSGLVQRLS